MKKASDQEPFSGKLETWLKGNQPKTINSLAETFGEKSFAVIVLLFMVVPALPLPTGGVTHVFEIISMLLALELIAGINKLWLPNRLKKVKLAPAVADKLVPTIIRNIRWFEARSSPRLKVVFRTTSRVIWVAVFIFTLVAFLAPPFSGLDTLPSLGVVLICLSIILDDGLILFFGLLAGALGTTIVIGLGAVITNFIRGLF